MRQSALRRFEPAMPLVAAVTLTWSLLLIATPGPQLAQVVSNVGLALIAGVAGLAAMSRARRTPSIARFWWLLGAASLCWSAGQVVWTWYESVLGREVPFPSPADLGYLAMPPLAVTAMLALPLAAPTLAGRIRTILDGLLVATSLLLVSWVVVLGPVFRAGGDSLLAQVISLAYPIGDTVVITMVVFTWLRARRSPTGLPLSLALVGCGLVAFAVADAGFVYLTTAGLYSSGSVIDIGWFAGFALMFLAALKQPRAGAGEFETEGSSDQLGTFLPYAAVTVALLTSVIELVREGQVDPFVSWSRSALMALLVTRQILTLRENGALTRHLEQRVTARTAELASSQQRFASLVQHSSDVVTVIDRSGVITYQSGSSERVLGRAAESMLGRRVREFMPATEAQLLEEAIELAAGERLRMQTVQNVWDRADGTECHLELTITNLLDNPEVSGLVLNCRDVTDRTVLEEQLVHQAFHDPLTSLANRAMFKTRLEHALARREIAPDSVAVLFLDLDGFKEVNDTLGHSSGDQLLVQVAQRLRDVVRPSDTVARFGGDEFALLVEDVTDLGVLHALAERINAVLSEPYTMASTSVHVTASVGIAAYGPHATDAEQLLRNADLAMYQAKAVATGVYAAYDPSMHAGLVERVRMEADLRSALEGDELVVHYQPLVAMRTGQVSGVEALVRWMHPERGLIPPLDFIPLAESTGLIKPLGKQVLRQACLQTVEWQRMHPDLETLKVSVNVSARQLDDRELIDVVRECLLESGLDPHCLTLEMTESVLLVDSPETLSTLREIRAMGVRLAIDDFGTGYSSLSYLHRFPVDVLKIDRSFVERLAHGGDAALVSTIVRLGHSMNLETVAEGIERADEMLMLRRQGCTTGQGYHFAPPLPVDALGELLGEQVGLVAAPAATATA